MTIIDDGFEFHPADPTSHEDVCAAQEASRLRAVAELPREKHDDAGGEPDQRDG